jgi:hypothetical protein
MRAGSVMGRSPVTLKKKTKTKSKNKNKNKKGKIAVSQPIMMLKVNTFFENKLNGVLYIYDLFEIVF